MDRERWAQAIRDLFTLEHSTLWSVQKSAINTVRNATWLVLQCTLFNYKTSRKTALKELETNQPVWSIGFINVHNTSLFYKEKNTDDKHRH